MDGMMCLWQRAISAGIHPTSPRELILPPRVLKRLRASTCLLRAATWTAVSSSLSVALMLTEASSTWYSIMLLLFVKLPRPWAKMLCCNDQLLDHANRGSYAALQNYRTAAKIPFRSNYDVLRQDRRYSSHSSHSLLATHERAFGPTSEIQSSEVEWIIIQGNKHSGLIFFLHKSMNNCASTGKDFLRQPNLPVVPGRLK